MIAYSFIQMRESSQDGEDRDWPPFDISNAGYVLSGIEENEAMYSAHC
jgi:hypothetical protein